MEGDEKSVAKKLEELREKVSEVEEVITANPPEDISKRELTKQLKDLKIITAILLGKNKNKELARVLDTDKSFASRKVKELEDAGLVTKEGEGKEVTYGVNQFRVLDFLTRRIVIKVKKKD